MFEDLDKLVISLMPAIPMGAALWLLYKMVTLFEAWLARMNDEHESMKKKLADIEKENLDLKEEQLGEMHDQVVELQNELDALEQSAPRTRRGQSPARHRGKSPGGRG